MYVRAALVLIGSTLLACNESPLSSIVPVKATLALAYPIARTVRADDLVIINNDDSEAWDYDTGDGLEITINLPSHNGESQIGSSCTLLYQANSAVHFQAVSGSVQRSTDQVSFNVETDDHVRITGAIVRD